MMLALIIGALLHDFEGIRLQYGAEAVRMLASEGPFFFVWFMMAIGIIS